MVDDFSPLLPKTKQNARELRRNQTQPEQILWRMLRGSRLAGLKFRRQHPIGPYTHSNLK